MKQAQCTYLSYLLHSLHAGILGLVYTVIIALVTSACGIFCTYFGSAIPGDIPRTPFSPRKSSR